MTETLSLIGHEPAELEVRKALESGHLHHAWIISGPSGIGKSRLTKRLGARLLGASNPDDLNDNCVQKILAGSHPDLKWVALEANEKGQLRQDISVDQIRDLNQFFSLKPALSGWRVAVIDALDHMNASGLNALLKTLEEPPEKCVIFLISHGEKPILPTIRSRCRILRLPILSDEDTIEVLRAIGADDNTPELAKGRPGLALQMQASGVAETIQAARMLLNSLKSPKPQLVSEALIKAGQSSETVTVFAQCIKAWCAERAETDTSYAALWLELQRIVSDGDMLNLTPLEQAGKIFSTVQAHTKRTPVHV